MFVFYGFFSLLQTNDAIKRVIVRGVKTFFAFLEKHKEHLPTVALVIGFAVDIVTFRNLNLLYSQIILVTHLAIVAFSIIILALPVREGMSVLFSRVRTWVPLLQQYSTGNLLSAYLVLYSASSSLNQSWPFFALLVIAIVGNETLKSQKRKLPFSTTLFFLNLLLFFALAVPIAVGTISVTSFLLALVVGAVVFQIFRWALRFSSREVFVRYRRSIHTGAIGVFITLTVLYFVNLIPPIPLALKTIDFYHAIERAPSGYHATSEVYPWYEQFFSVRGKTLHLASSERAYVFTAIFAPARIDTRMVHRWEYWSDESSRWEERNRVEFPISGGRAEGYRGFSFIDHVEEGRWRVSVETTRGQVVGRAYVQVDIVETTPTVVTREL